MAEVRFFPPGKLPSKVLSRMLATYTRDHPRLLVGPRVGADAAAVEFDRGVLVLKTDPITFPTPDAGRYLVHVNANDIACMGATPTWLLVTALLPEQRTDEALVESLFAGISSAADELGITLVGGHVEITIGIDRPILVGQMLGETMADELYDLRTARPGDRVLLVNGIAIEGSAILANDGRPEDLERVSEATLDRAKNFTRDPGISVVPAVQSLRRSGSIIRGCHDPTEGGLATALHELTAVTECGLEIDIDEVSIYPECAELCNQLGLDPLGLIASGALIAVVDPDGEQAAIDRLQRDGFRASTIGSLLEDGSAKWMRSGSDLTPIPEFDVDEIARYFQRR